MPRGWTAQHDVLLRELVHHSQPGGLNQEDPRLSWSEIAVRFNKLTVERSLGHQKFHWNKIAARYYDFVKPLYVNVGNKGKEVADNKGEDATIEDEDKKEAWVLVEK